MFENQNACMFGQLSSFKSHIQACSRQFQAHVASFRQKKMFQIGGFQSVRWSGGLAGPDRANRGIIAPQPARPLDHAYSLAAVVPACLPLRMPVSSAISRRHAHTRSPRLRVHVRPPPVALASSRYPPLPSSTSDVDEACRPGCIRWQPLIVVDTHTHTHPSAAAHREPGWPPPN